MESRQHIAQKAFHAFLGCLGVLILIVGLSACNPEKDIDLDLPVPDRGLVVECYLEPGKPYQLLLTQSVPYFGDFNLAEDIDEQFLVDALVVITHNGVADTLNFDLTSIFLALTDTNANWFDGRSKIHNYVSTTIVPEDYNSDFELYVEDTAGNILTASTRLLPPVQHDTLEIEFNADSSEALVRGRWQDDPAGPNWYRWVHHKLKRNGRQRYQFNFVLDDRIGNGQEYVVATFYDYEPGDCLLVSLYHLDQELANYLETVDDAESSNGNPFAQPGSILSNVEGGIGIFSGLTVDQDTLQIPR